MLYQLAKIPFLSGLDISVEIYLSGDYVQQSCCSCRHLTEEHTAGPQCHQEHRVTLYTVLTEHTHHSTHSQLSCHYMFDFDLIEGRHDTTNSNFG